MVDLVRQWRGRFAALSARDQRAALLLGVALALVIGYLGLFRPLWQYYASSKAAFASARAVASWLHEREAVLRQAGAQAAPGVAAPGGEQSLVATLSATAAARDIAIARLEPHADGVRVWIDHTQFAQLLLWLDALRADHGVIAREAVIDRNPEHPEHITARLELAVVAK